jgi:TRAP-type C4-dicarboxylate transport system permease small subunit
LAQTLPNALQIEAKLTGTGVSLMGDRMVRWLELVLAYAFLAAVALNFCNVTGRYLFGQTLLSADELQIFSMVIITFLGAGVVAWRSQHLRMSVLVGALPPPARQVIAFVELVSMIALAIFVLWNSTNYAAQMFKLGRVSDMANIPMWIPHAVVALGFGLIAIAGCRYLLRAAIRIFGR